MAVTYNVYRDGTMVAAGVAVTAFHDSGLTDGTPYSYQVSAVVNGIEGPKAGPLVLTPLAVSRPFAAPTTSGTSIVPLTIDHTGATDVSADLNNWLAAQPNGRIIQFPSNPSYVYRLNQGIQFANRNNLIFDGGMVTLRAAPSTSGQDQLSSPFVSGHTYGGSWDNNNSDIVIRNFNIEGSNPNPGVFTSGIEAQHSLCLTGAQRIEVYNITGSGAWGDFAFWELVTSGWLHNCHAIDAGRNGVSVISGSSIINETSQFDTSGYLVCDVEPNVVGDACSNIYFRNNGFGTWGVAEFFALEGSHTGAPINGIFVTGNTGTGKSIQAVCDNGGTSRMKNVVFSGNAGAGSVAGPALIFAHIDGLTVQHNVQSLSGGSLVSVNDCPGAVTTPNP